MGLLFENSGEQDEPRLKTNWVSSIVIPKIFDDIDSFFHKNDISLNDTAFLSRIHGGIFATNRSVDGEQLATEEHPATPNLLIVGQHGVTTLYQCLGYPPSFKLFISRTRGCCGPTSLSW